MSEKIIPPVFSPSVNVYSGVGATKSTPKPTMVIDANILDYGDVFEKRNFEPGRLYSLEKNGKVKGLFEGKKNGDFVSLTRTQGDGILEKVKTGATTLMARFSQGGGLTDLVEIAGDKMTFISRGGHLSEAVGRDAQIKLSNIVRGIKVL